MWGRAKHTGPAGAATSIQEGEAGHREPSRAGPALPTRAPACAAPAECPFRPIPRPCRCCPAGQLAGAACVKNVENAALNKSILFFVCWPISFEGKYTGNLHREHSRQGQKKYAPTREIVRNLVRKTCNTLIINVSCGGSRIRTGDLLNANQTLYQLSYTPEREKAGTLPAFRRPWQS